MPPRTNRHLAADRHAVVIVPLGPAMAMAIATTPSVTAIVIIVTVVAVIAAVTIFALVTMITIIAAMVVIMSLSRRSHRHGSQGKPSGSESFGDTHNTFLHPGIGYGVYYATLPVLFLNDADSGCSGSKPCLEKGNHIVSGGAGGLTGSIDQIAGHHAVWRPASATERAIGIARAVWKLGALERRPEHGAQRFKLFGSRQRIARKAIAANLQPLLLGACFDAGQIRRGDVERGRIAWRHARLRKRGGQHHRVDRH